MVAEYAAVLVSRTASEASRKYLPGLQRRADGHVRRRRGGSAQMALGAICRVAEGAGAC